MDTDGGNVQELPSFGTDDFGPVFDPTDRYIALSSDSVGEGVASDAYINIIDRSGIHIKRLERQGMDYIFSPDGQSVAFSTGPKLYLESVLSQNSLCLASVVRSAGWLGPTPRIGHPSFHPTGEKLCFTSSQDHPGRSEVYTIQCDGTQCTRISYMEKGSDNPIFSPTGEAIYFISSASSNGRPRQIFKVNQHSLDVAPIANTEGVYGDLTSSLDGRWLLYTSFPNNDRQIGGLDISLLDLRNGQAYTVIEDGYYNRYPAFSPSSNTLVYCSYREKITEIYRLDITNLVS